MVSKSGADPQSGWTLVQASPGPDIDFACARIGFCRWGDYAGASPDPNPSPTSLRGAVWLSGMWTSDGRLLQRGTSWRTVNWAASP
jgi:hypothetical protein